MTTTLTSWAGSVGVASDGLITERSKGIQQREVDPGGDRRCLLPSSESDDVYIDEQSEAGNPIWTTSATLIRDQRKASNGRVVPRVDGQESPPRLAWQGPGRVPLSDRP